LHGIFAAIKCQVKKLKENVTQIDLSLSLTTQLSRKQTNWLPSLCCFDCFVRSSFHSSTKYCWENWPGCLGSRW